MSVTKRRSSIEPLAEDASPPCSPRADTTAPRLKKKRWAYLWWLIGWWCGGHHWYLERNAQGFLYTLSLGGLIGCSVLDFFLIPYYVNEANRDRTQEPPPPTGRTLGGSLVYLLRFSLFLLVAFLVDHFVRDEAGRNYSHVAGTIIAMPVLFLGRGCVGFPNIFAVLIIAFFCVVHKEEDDDEEDMDDTMRALLAGRVILACSQATLSRTTKPAGRWPFVVRILFFASAFATVAMGTHYLRVTNDDGTTGVLADKFAVIGESLSKIQEEVNKAGGYHTLYKQAVDKFWEWWYAEADAYEVLELPKTATTKEIQKQFRKLSKKYHPDLPNGSVEKQQAINKAYNLIKGNRLS